MSPVPAGDFSRSFAANVLRGNLLVIHALLAARQT